MNITIDNFKEKREAFEGIVLAFWDAEFNDTLGDFRVDVKNDADEETKLLFRTFNDETLRDNKAEIFKEFINLVFDKLFLFSHNNNIYFNNCSFTVYESTFESRFYEYKTTFVDATKIDFAKVELERSANNKGLYTDYLNQTNKKRTTDSFNKKLFFLQTILSQKQHYSTIHKGPELIDLFTQQISFKQHKPQQVEPELLDLSDSTAIEKFITANELGMIDYLRSKSKIGISNNSLASALSAITGVKAQTIRPNLNRLQKDIDNSDPKHPYATQNTVDKVRKRLEDLGF